jgi:hypothetical protein
MSSIKKSHHRQHSSSPTASSSLSVPTTTTTSSSRAGDDSSTGDEWKQKAKSYKHKMRTLIELLRRERDDNEAEFAQLEAKLEHATHAEAIAIKRTHEQTLLLDQLRARLDDATAHASLLRKENADLRHSLRSNSSVSSSGSHRSRHHSKRSEDSADSAASAPLVASLRARVADLEANCEKAFADLEAAQRGAVVKLQAAAQVVVRLENRVDELNQLLAERSGAAPATPAPLPPASSSSSSSSSSKIGARERPDDAELSSSASASGRRHQTVHAASPTTAHRDKLKSSAPAQLASSGSAIGGSSSPSVKKSKRASNPLSPLEQPLQSPPPPSSRAPVPEPARLTDSPRVTKSPQRVPPLPADAAPSSPSPPVPRAADPSTPPPADTAAIVDLQSMMAQLAARSAMASAAASAEMDMLNATIARSDTMLRTTEDIRAAVRGKLERKPTYSRNKALDELVNEAAADVGD